MGVALAIVEKRVVVVQLWPLRLELFKREALVGVAEAAVRDKFLAAGKFHIAEFAHFRHVHFLACENRRECILDTIVICMRRAYFAQAGCLLPARTRHQHKRRVNHRANKKSADHTRR